MLLNGAAAPAFGRDFTFTSAQPINTEPRQWQRRR
eukprot:COSAG01_NODE_15788_length_1300_cov_1.017485_2_plen_34_part_01